MGGVGSLIGVVFGILWTVVAFAITRDCPLPIVGWIFPLFGIVFIGCGLASAGYNFFNATTKNRLSVLDLTSPGEEPDPLNVHFGEEQEETTAARLAKLDDLKQRNLISTTEFAEQRRRILGEI